jgi:hypothetical protein
MLRADAVTPRALSLLPKTPLTVPLMGNRNVSRKQGSSPIRDEQHIVPQRRSSRKCGAHEIAQVVDKTLISNLPGDHKRSSEVNSSTSPLRVRKIRENKVMPPPLAGTSKSPKVNAHKHIVDESQPRRESFEKNPGSSMLLLANNAESTLPSATFLISSKPRLDFHLKECGEEPPPEPPSASTCTASNSLQQTRKGSQQKYSIRKRVFTRVLGSIQGKGKGTSSTTGVQGNDTSFKRSSNDMENSDSTLSSNLDLISTPRESTTTDTSEYDSDNWESVIPNSTTPSAKAVLGVTATTSPEVESFDLSGAGSIWAAIQIRGEMFMPEGLATVECDRSIDLAIVIDNSYVG